jgi:post-segregation antitoxin (ccd killing protein)
MKRTNVIVDEELLEKARAATGERTYSATITKGLELLVQRQRFQKALERVQELAAEGDFFDREYVTRMWPDVASRLWPPQRASAHERRLPTRKATRRGTR